MSCRNLSCRDRNVISLRGTMLGDYVNDLRHFLVVTGDPIAQNDRNTITQVFDYNSIKFMGLLQEMNEDQFYRDRIVYGGALNYQGVGVDAIARRMKLKMEQGCSFFLTQPIYADADVERIKDLKDRTGAKIIGGIMPLVSRKNALFIANEMPGMHVPPETLAYYEEGMSRSEYEEVAIRVSVEIARKMSSIVDGYYFMTPFNRVELICNIMSVSVKKIYRNLISMNRILVDIGKKEFYNKKDIKNKHMYRNRETRLKFYFKTYGNGKGSCHSYCAFDRTGIM